MEVRRLRSDERLAVGTDQAAVCLPCRPEHEFEVALRSVGLHCSLDTALVVVVGEDAAEDAEMRIRAIDGVGMEALMLVAPAADLLAGFNALCEACPGSDVVIVSAGCRVGPGWLEALDAAVRSDTAVASAAPLDAGAPPLAALLGEGPLPVGDGMSADPQLVRVLAPRAGCMRLRRSALDLLGALDPAWGRFERALARWLARAARSGWVHVVTDATVVLTEPRQLLGSDPDEADMNSDSLRRVALARATAIRRMTVTLDCRALTARAGGTQTYALGLARALAGRADVDLRVVVPEDVPGEVTRELRGAGAELLDADEVAAVHLRTDIVHRPQQVFSDEDLFLLRLLGERLVVTQLDLIGYRNPSYHDSCETWLGYRRLVARSLASADRVIFISGHARADALGEDLVSAGRSAVVGIGVDDQPNIPEEELRAPATLARAGVVGAPMLLCLGSDYAHKNRPFALRLLAELRRRHGWEGVLVLAGGHVPHGSSAEEERSILARDPGLASAVIDVGMVNDGEREWLYRNARASVCPTVYEGFGLGPLESARAGVPCAYAAVSSLAEVAGTEAATLVPWDVAASAAAMVPLLTDEAARARHLEALRLALDRWRWDAVVERMVEVYRRALAGTPSVTGEWRELELKLGEYERRVRVLEGTVEFERIRAGEYSELHDLLVSDIGEGIHLVGSGGLLTRAQQRGLMRIASRRGMRVLLAPLSMLGAGAKPLPTSAGFDVREHLGLPASDSRSKERNV